MRRTMLKSKIHRATLTGSDLNYVGSITVDADLLEASDIREHEMVHVLDIDNGARFETYTIAGARGSGEMQVNGAAARLVHTGDKVIVVSYAAYEEAELESYEPKVVHVNSENHIDARLLRHLGGGIVVGGDHGDRLAERLLLRQGPQGHGLALGRRGRGDVRAGAHASSSETASSTVTMAFVAFTCTTRGS